MRALPGPEAWAWEVNGNLVFRFPRDDARRAKVEVEARVLAALPAAARAPRIEWLSPRGYSGHRLLRGTGGDVGRPPRTAWPGLARDLGDALDAVHATPPPEGVPRKRLPAADALLARARRDAELVGADPALLTAPGAGPGAVEVLCHGDLKPEHVLLDGDRLAGIVDWADACVGDSVRDLAGLVLWLGPGSRGSSTRRTPAARPSTRAASRSSTSHARCAATGTRRSTWCEPSSSGHFGRSREERPLFRRPG